MDSSPLEAKVSTIVITPHLVRACSSKWHIRRSLLTNQLRWACLSFGLTSDRVISNFMRVDLEWDNTKHCYCYCYYYFYSSASNGCVKSCPRERTHVDMLPGRSKGLWGLLVLLTVRSSEGGCRGAGLCCPGRDLSCVTQDRRIDGGYGDCFCDQACLSTLDCCHDYNAACPGIYSFQRSLHGFLTWSVAFPRVMIVKQIHFIQYFIIR